MRDEAIKLVMTESPVTVAPGDLLLDARELFEPSGVHHLPVLDNGKLVGILSASDFLKLHLADQSSPSVKNAQVRHIMHANPVVIDARASLRDVAEKLRAAEFHALPVVGDDGELVGIVTTTDLVETLLQHLPRGDGSLREEPAGDSQGLASEHHRLMAAVCQAADRYLHSGHAEHEHSVLIKRLADLRAADSLDSVDF